MTMTKGRLEAFSDGVLAVIITIMVLELKVPRGSDLRALDELAVPFLTYALSFAYVGIYWNNHHHLFHATRAVSGGIMWANLHLLFWISLIPFSTGWVGQNPSASWPAALYGTVFFMAAVGWFILERAIIAKNGKDSELARSVGADLKAKISQVLYLAGILLSFQRAWIGDVMYALVALIWIVPDRRIEGRMDEGSRPAGGAAS